MGAELLRFRLAESGGHAYAEGIEALAKALRQGLVVAFPTDTVWGVAVLADEPKALRRIFELKGRDPEKSLPVFVSSEAQARELLEEFPEEFARLAARYWPGGLTLVGRPRQGLLLETRAPDGTVALRVPAIRLVQRLLTALARPVACTSANRSGVPPLEGAAAVQAALGAGLAFIADSDEPAGGLPSTVVAMRDGRPTVLRAGAVSEEDVLRVASGISLDLRPRL
jgi:tRNA threonylcarbamoyl adenosine modification protein (Sua5/YciO/YrdC/YwlC family)